MSPRIWINVLLCVSSALLPAVAGAAVWEWVPKVPSTDPRIVGAGLAGVFAIATVALVARRGRRARRRRAAEEIAQNIPDTLQLSERLARELDILSEALGRLAATGQRSGRASPEPDSGSGKRLAEVAEQVARAGRMLAPKGEKGADQGLWLSRVEEAVGGLDALTEDAASLDRLLTTLCELSDRTQLLAINAAIEATKAGESGRGLARVADDVRLMARDSRHAARKLERVMAGTARSARDVREIISSGAAVYRSGLVFERRKDKQAGEAAHLLTCAGSELEKLKESLGEVPADPKNATAPFIDPELAKVLAELHGAAQQLSVLSARLNACLQRTPE
jgi:methyl-accepting chemotaxis protein